MKIKKIMVVTLFLLCLLMIGAVSAASDTNDIVKSDATTNEASHSSTATTSTNNDVVEKTSTTAKYGETDTDEISSTSNDVIKGTGSSDDGNLTTLKDKIDNSGPNAIIELNNNYTYNKGFDSSGITITDGRNITINGNGYTIDAKGQARIFNINNAQLIINNLNIINSYNNNGGAIYAINSNVTITGSTFTQNNATTYGGAIYIENGNLKVSETTFINNTAKQGGAIYNNGNATIMADFTNNTVTSTITTIKALGGAIYNKGKATITSTFTGNKARTGGAIYNNGNATITSTFTENNATNEGGAIYTNTEHNTTLINSTFTKNHAESNGGAISSGTRTKLNITESTFTENTAGNLGGAIYVYRNNVTITGSTFTQNNATDGGAIYSNETNTTIINSTFTKNSANLNGGAVLSGSTSQLIVTGSTFTENTAGNLGGAINNRGNATINNVQFTKNNATEGAGAIFNYASTKNKLRAGFMNITQSTFTQNTGTNGGAILNTNNGFIKITQSRFTENNATNGGAIYGQNYYEKNAMGSKIEITYSLFQKNNATNGSDIYTTGRDASITAIVNGEKNAFIEQPNTFEESGHITLTDNVICRDDSFTKLYYMIITEPTNTITLDQNYRYYSTSSDEYGNDSEYITGIPINTTITINGNGYTIDGNNTARIFNVNNSELTLINITLTQGKGQSDDPDDWSVGGAIYANNTNMTIIDCILTQNNADYGGAITALDNCNVTITGSLFTKNNANNGSSIYIKNILSLNVNHNIFLNNTGNYEIYNETALTSYDINYNWFGNNATDYDKLKSDLVDGLNIDNWLFLNATSNPNPVTTSSTNNIIFKLSLYNKTNNEISEYDNSVFYPVNLTITSINGSTDKSSVNLNESFNYIAPAGESSVTASIEDAEYTINAKYPTTFKIQNIPNFYEGSKIELTVTEKNKYTGPVIIIIGTETYTVNMVNGEGKLSITPKLSPGTYNAKIDFTGNNQYAETTTTSNTFKIIAKLNTNIIASKKTFTLEYKNKQYSVTLKDSKGKVLKNTKVRMKVNGKTYTTTTNSKGIATFKINLNKKGTFNAEINYNGDYAHNKAVKKVQLTVKPFLISKGSKDKNTVKKIQRALKNNGYYLYAKKHYLKIDGIYHKWTQKAVKQYQKAKGLKVTGKVDYTTAKKLKII